MLPLCVKPPDSLQDRALSSEAFVNDGERVSHVGWKDLPGQSLRLRAEDAPQFGAVDGSRYPARYLPLGRELTRFRALLFGEPLAPWQAIKELAEQVATETGEGSRDPHSGFAFLSPGVTIEVDEGDPPALTPNMERWAEALTVVKLHGAAAAETVGDRAHATTEGGRDAPPPCEWGHETSVNVVSFQRRPPPSGHSAQLPRRASKLAGLFFGDHVVCKHAVKAL